MMIVIPLRTYEYQSIRFYSLPCRSVLPRYILLPETLIDDRSTRVFLPYLTKCWNHNSRVLLAFGQQMQIDLSFTLALRSTLAIAASCTSSPFPSNVAPCSLNRLRPGTGMGFVCQ